MAARGAADGWDWHKMNDQRNGGIGWTDFTANPVRYRNAEGTVVWGCVKASAGCTNCYAETLAERYGKGGPFNAAVQAKLATEINDKELNAMRTSPKIAFKRVFVGDMTDMFGEWVPDAMLDRIFKVFEERSDVVWQVLTKRAERMHEYINDPRTARQFATWPLPNVWLGTSTENQEQANARVPWLLKTAAAVRYVSYEPALGPVDFTKIEYEDGDTLCCWNALTGEHEVLGSMSVDAVTTTSDGNGVLSWGIAGGESGGGARPNRVEWMRQAVQQFKQAGVALYMKQLGALVHWNGVQGGFGDGPSNVWPFKWSERSEPITDGWRIRLTDRKGVSMVEWPDDLKVRQFPEAAHG
jgi:protein gp37